MTKRKILYGERFLVGMTSEMLVQLEDRAQYEAESKCEIVRRALQQYLETTVISSLSSEVTNAYQP